MSALFVVIGGFFGAISRYGISQWVKKRYAPAFPFATLAVNLTGAFLLGFIVGSGIGTSWQRLLGTGFMGAFTTFSTFKLESIELHAKGNRDALVSYLAVSYVIGIFLAFVGLSLGASLIR